MDAKQFFQWINCLNSYLVFHYTGGLPFLGHFYWAKIALIGIGNEKFCLVLSEELKTKITRRKKAIRDEYSDDLT